VANLNGISDNIQNYPINYKSIVLSIIILTIFKEESSYTYETYYQSIKNFLIKGLNLCNSIDDIVYIFSDIPNINNTLNHYTNKSNSDISTDILNFKNNNTETFELIKELYIENILIGQYYENTYKTT